VAEYVYGVVRPGRAPSAGPGVAGAPVRLLEGDRAAAMVSQIDDGGELLLGRDDLTAHARVLEEALGHGPVLPMRAGIALADEAEVRGRLLEAHGEELRVALERFEGCFQVGVRAVYEEAALMRDAMSLDPQIARLRDVVKGLPEDAAYPQRIRLGELVAEAVERIRQADSAALVELLSQVSEDVEVTPPAHERVALNAAFLLDRARSEEFDRVLEAFAEGQAGRLRVRCIGPLPPHSFVELAGAA
jgi:hypothetical protein